MKRLLIFIMLLLGSVGTAFSQAQVSSRSGTINGHGYVDLGLSVKWATCNVGASVPSDYGNYYAWAETKTKSKYTSENSSTDGKRMPNIAGNAQYDAARANWGGTWRLPTKAEIEELARRCKWEWMTVNGHRGCKVTGPNGNSIFLPAAGWRMDSTILGEGERGFYWSSTPYDDGLDYGVHHLAFYEAVYDSDWSQDAYIGSDFSYRSSGQSVRPVVN